MFSGAFLQSPEWEKFQQSLGRKTWRIDSALIIKMPLPLGFSYFYCPKKRLADELRIKKLARQERVIFLRIEPAEEPPKNFIKTKDVQPKCTLITGISKSENELLAEMHEKTRYNIRLAIKKGVKVEKSEIPNPKSEINSKFKIQNSKFFEDFYALLQKTSARQEIKLHSKEYYKKLAEFNNIFVAYYENKPVATAMVNFYENTATYLHGGSDEKYKNLMAPHLLHWEIIKTARARGIKFYDWWGIDEKKWPGLTRFKRGFGGQEICAPGAYDLPIDKFWYWVYKFSRR